MSSDYTRTKPNYTGQYPQKVVSLNGEGAAGFTRVEEWITPNKLRQQYLFGIPLTSPLTGQTLDDDTLKDIIRRAAANVELTCRIDVTPVQRIDRIDFDRTKYLQGWNQLQLSYGNVKSLEEVSIRANNSISPPTNPQTAGIPPEGSQLYNVPLEWIDMNYAFKGILHFVPLQTTFNSYGVIGPSAGAAAPLFAIFSQLQWVPSFWFVRYTTGFAENAIPAPVNDLVGATAAMEVLSLVGPVNRNNSQSISLDGASQAISNPGVQIYVTRYQQLQEKVQFLTDLVKSRFTKSIFMTNF